MVLSCLIAQRAYRCIYWFVLALFTLAERVLDLVIFWSVSSLPSTSTAIRVRHDVDVAVLRLLHIVRYSHAAERRIPLYYEAKLLFVIWLWHPQSMGAVSLYTKTVQPLLSHYEPQVDHFVAEGRSLASDAFSANIGKYVSPSCCCCVVVLCSHWTLAMVIECQTAIGPVVQPHRSYSLSWCRVIAWLQEKGSIAFTRLQDMQQKVSRRSAAHCQSPVCRNTPSAYLPVMHLQAHRS